LAPTALRDGDDRIHLYYELHVHAEREVELTRVAVVGDGTALVTYGPDLLDERARRPIQPRSESYGRVVRPRTPTVVFIALLVPEGRRVRRLRHDITFGSGATSEATLTAQAAPPVVLGPPLRDGLWLAHNGPGDHRAAHWGSMLVSGRRITVPQRFAIDFQGVDPDGRAVRRPPEGSANSDWPGFGRDVIAVANGTVRESRDGIVDTPPLYEPPPPRSPDLQDAGGNYVVLDIGTGRFVHFVHLQQGSVRVRPGQRVARGDLLGRVGNSGNTNAPTFISMLSTIRGRRGQKACRICSTRSSCVDAPR
jgi:hypothetical protein